MVGLNQTIPGLRVWTSWLKRTIQTSAHINAPQVQISSQKITYKIHLVPWKWLESNAGWFQERWRALNEIDAGCMENLTYEEIYEKFASSFDFIKDHVIVPPNKMSRKHGEPQLWVTKWVQQTTGTLRSLRLGTRTSWPTATQAEKATRTSWQGHL